MQKQIFKRLFLAVLSLSLIIFPLTSCDGISAEAQAKSTFSAYMKVLQLGNYDALKAILGNFISDTSMLDKIDSTKGGRRLMDTLCDELKAMKYEITDVSKTDDSNCDLDVSITARNYESVIASLKDSISMQISSDPMVLNDLLNGSDEAISMVAGMAADAIENNTSDETVTNTCTVRMTKGDKVWQVSDVNSDMFEYVFGNLLSELQNLSIF